MKFESQVVHAGDRKRACGHIPSTVPIHLGTTFFYNSAEKLDRVMGNEEEGFSYSRYGNPTNQALEELAQAMESGAGALATSSGMAAIQIAVQAALLDRPHSIVASNALYGATIKMFDQVFAPFDVDVTYTDICDLAALEKSVTTNKPGVVFVESISNPLVRVGRLDKIAGIARAAGAALIVDNTFATPMMVRPLELGASMVIHSATKYLAGHGDVLGGLVISDEEHLEVVRALSRTIGPVLGPFDSYLTMRGIKTFALRFERQCQNAAEIARWLQRHARIDRVYHCADPDHPDAEAIRTLFTPGLYSGIVSFEIKDAGKADVLAFMDRLQMVVPGTSLGDVHSLLLYPVMASHRDISPKTRERMGIKENLVRLAVGIESVDDIIEDLDRALVAVS
ncbi:MAG TPA: PLP-dependent aspartate aminotransferase family protein [Bryobacteraceae bacterium]|jgi:cystathionine gamma-synthase/methionine-gamma-lyase|nr:PLP-dependent aspartate aminotransferase family protein [Bryobacteraceae bacterium]